MLILVTNDDGIRSPGLRALQQTLQELGTIAIMAPDRERSAVSHALTLHSPLRAERLAEREFAIEGTPTDCINLAIHGLLKQTPDLIVSGINRGANLGDDIIYSGTVAAAMEGAMMGVPAVAVSLECLEFDGDELARAAEVTAGIVRHVSRGGLPHGTFLNVNVPKGHHRGHRLTRQGRRRYPDQVVEKRDPRGRAYYWLGGGGSEFESLPGTDFDAVRQGYVSITPLHTDLTNDKSFPTLQRWGGGNFFVESL